MHSLSKIGTRFPNKNKKINTINHFLRNGEQNETELHVTQVTTNTTASSVTQNMRLYEKSTIDENNHIALNQLSSTKDMKVVRKDMLEILNAEGQILRHTYYKMKSG